ncbi:hypothetical protein [Fusibacter tunisiensis]|uniref:DUF3169 family protein n=1 Tax=Fusibacter tunisiensis TaxID=1008308 RepID=A0ABS2MP14_9FIRM|nr:hypothetical protein [Fusibacter tunisiensis]MBM7561144.1 hypothetical protein [Fusibacter tunisiensis]
MSECNMMEQEAILVEYQALRDEIISDKENRMNTLGFTIAGIGTAMAFVLGLESTALETYNNFSFGLIAYSLVMVLIALIMTLNFTKSISRVGTYIKHIIEPQIKGLNWEKDWQSGLGHLKKKRMKERKIIFKNAAKGQSRAYSLYYFILSTAIYAVSFMVDLWQIPVYMVIITLFYLINVFMCSNLWLRFFGEWI